MYTSNRLIMAKPYYIVTSLIELKKRNNIQRKCFDNTFGRIQS